MTENAPTSAAHRRSRFLAANALAVAVAAVLAACSSGGGGGAGQAPSTVFKTVTPSAPSRSSSSAAPTPTKPTGPTKPVHVSLFEGDGQTYGVGMPLIAQFSRKVTDARPFNEAVTVTVNGHPAHGAWFWVGSSSGYPMEAHYRTEHYWPAHSRIEMRMPLRGVSAGPGLSFDDSLTLDMNIGAAHISTVDGINEHMAVTSDGHQVRVVPVSLGKATTPTYLGTKVVIEKKNPQHMIGTADDPYSVFVPWSVRLTNSGEFIHAASWNTGNIGNRSTSHGCTNLTAADAQWFYRFAVKGDVVTYTNTGTTKTMPSWDGYGDWNVPWSEWVKGNLLKNH